MRPLRIIFTGTPELAAQCLQALLDSQHSVIAVLTQPDKPAGRGQALQESAVKQLAQQKQILILQPKTLKDPVQQQRLTEFKPDLIVNVAYGLIFPKAVLDIPRLGCINVHPSLLPRWRGASPIVYPILSGDQETGVSIMKMEVGLDTGPILLQEKCPIAADDTTESLQKKLVEMAKPMLIKAVDLLSEDQGQWIPQNDLAATFSKKIQKADAQIIWTKSAEVLDREIRAFYPWPISWTTIGGQTIRIYKASVQDKNTHREAPGKILDITDAGLDVATDQGIIRLEMIQFPGKKALPFKEILCGRKAFFEKESFLQ